MQWQAKHSVCVLINKFHSNWNTIAMNLTIIIIINVAIRPTNLLTQSNQLWCLHNKISAIFIIMSDEHICAHIVPTSRTKYFIFIRCVLIYIVFFSLSSYSPYIRVLLLRQSSNWILQIRNFYHSSGYLPFHVNAQQHCTSSIMLSFSSYRQSLFAMIFCLHLNFFGFLFLFNRAWILVRFHFIRFLLQSSVSHRDNQCARILSHPMNSWI